MELEWEIFAIMWTSPTMSSIVLVEGECRVLILTTWISLEVSVISRKLVNTWEGTQSRVLRNATHATLLSGNQYDDICSYSHCIYQTIFDDNEIPYTIALASLRIKRVVYPHGKIITMIPNLDTTTSSVTTLCIQCQYISARGVKREMSEDIKLSIEVNQLQQQ